MKGHFAISDNGNWTWEDNPCLTIHGQYVIMYGSCGFVNFELIDSELIRIRNKIKR